MADGGLRTLIILMGGAALVLLVLLRSPGYLANSEFLGAIIVAQVVFAALVRYRKIFFLILMASFLWAGMDLPLRIAWLQVRWFVLGVGSLAGFAIYLKVHGHYFGTLHL